MGIPIEEMETTINQYGREKTLTVYTSNPVMLGKLRKAAELYPEAVKLEHGDKYGAQYSMPASYILKPSIRPPVKRNISEEERDRLRLQMAELRQNQF